MTKKKHNLEGLSLIVQLADQLGVNLKDSQVAIATEDNAGTVRMYDGSLEATISPTSRRSMFVDSPRSPSIYIELVDHQRDALAPEGAVYCVHASMPVVNMGQKSYQALNGDIFCVYVGKSGIILDDAARKRAAELLKK